MLVALARGSDVCEFRIGDADDCLARLVAPVSCGVAAELVAVGACTARMDVPRSAGIGAKDGIGDATPVAAGAGKAKLDVPVIAVPGRAGIGEDVPVIVGAGSARFVVPNGAG
jgi:hypothetical protein